MLDPNLRLRAILSSYKLRFPGESELALLSRIDARVVPLLLENVEFLPPTKETLNGFVALMGALDDRLAELGHPEFRDHPRLQGAKVYFGKPETSVKDAILYLPIYQDLRQELWKGIAL